jgi:hypothetical protein
VIEILTRGQCGLRGKNSTVALRISNTCKIWTNPQYPAILAGQQPLVKHFSEVRGKFR